MSQRTINLAIDDAMGAPVDATSVVVGTAGVVRTDTNAVVVAAGTAFTHVATGQYSLTFTEPAPALSYNYSVTYTLPASGAQTLTGTLPAVTLSAGPWPYGTIDDVRAEMGAFNEGVAADPDQTGNAATIAAHEQQAGDYATAYINSRLAALSYAAPATASLSPLRFIFAKLAAYQLYQVRGMQDRSSKGGGYSNAFTAKREEAREELEELLYNNRGGFARVTGYADAPVGVGATVDACGRTWPGTWWGGYPWGW